MYFFAFPSLSPWKLTSRGERWKIFLVVVYVRGSLNYLTKARLKLLTYNLQFLDKSMTMAGNKRKHGQDSPHELYSNKSRSKPTAEARVDPTYGQRSAIPGLDDDAQADGDEEELNYDDQDALSYLRAVRLVLSSRS